MGRGVLSGLGEGGAKEELGDFLGGVDFLPLS